MLAYAWFAWWWWWWIAIIFLWLIFIPPFGYGARWYTTYRGRRFGDPYAGVVQPGISPWASIESRFIDAPAAALTQADLTVTPLVEAAGRDSPTVADYRTAHEIMLKDQRGEASADDQRRAMQLYRSVYQRLTQRT